MPRSLRLEEAIPEDREVTQGGFHGTLRPQPRLTAEPPQSNARRSSECVSACEVDAAECVCVLRVCSELFDPDRRPAGPLLVYAPSSTGEEAGSVGNGYESDRGRGSVNRT